MRLPSESLAWKSLLSFAVEDVLEIRRAKDSIILHFISHSQEDDVNDDGREWIGALAPLRSDLLAGDLRSLYLTWLSSLQQGQVEDEDLEPIVPAGLSEPSSSLERLMDFLSLPEILVEVAAMNSAPLQESSKPVELKSLVCALTEKEKTNLLFSALSDSGSHWKSMLLARFERERGSVRHESALHCRRVGDILSAANARSEEEARKRAKDEAVKEARRKAEEEAERARYLDQLQSRESEVWNEVIANILKRQPKSYDYAVSLLTDLRDMSVRRGDLSGFALAARGLREKHSTKGMFIRRLDQAKL